MTNDILTLESALAQADADAERINAVTSPPMVTVSMDGNIDGVQYRSNGAPAE